MNGARDPIEHRHRLRVYWEDTDAGGVVFYANYLKFFERARTEWLRALGFEQQAMRDRDGTIFVVSHTALNYLAPARLDDLLEITVEVRERGRASLAFHQQAWRLGADGTPAVLLTEGTIRIGCVDAQNIRPRRIPAPVLERLGAASTAS
ncbi:MAG: tol-pal system-associated acyl-CoA thioesterase [Pseudomonadota bacterium]